MILSFSFSFGERFKENLGEDGKSNRFDLGEWLSQGDNEQKLEQGKERLSNEYGFYDAERLQMNDQDLYRAKEELKKCGSIGCVDKWNKIISNIEISLKRTGVEANREKVASDKKEPTCGPKCRAQKEKELSKLKAKDEKLKKEYVFTEEDKKLYEANKEYREKQKLEELREYALSNGLDPNNIRIIVRDEQGNELVFESLKEYEHLGNKEELDSLRYYESKLKDLDTQYKNAKTKEEREKIQKEKEFYYKGQTGILEGIQQRGSLGGIYITGNYLLNSGISYNGKTLLVSNEKMSAEVGAEKIGITIDNLGKIGTGIWSNQKVKMESELTQKYGTSEVKETNLNTSFDNKNQNRRDEFLSQVENKKLRNLIEQDYRENGSVNDGGVASVIGQDVKGSDHIEKSRNLYDAYRKILNQSNNAKRNIEGAAKVGKDISGTYKNKDIILNEKEEKVIKELIENLRDGRSNYFNNN